MATISSSDDSSTPPKEFHLSTSSYSDSRMSLDRQKCPLCRKLSDSFYCKQCIHSGSFYSTRERSLESFFEKRVALLELKNNTRNFGYIISRLQEPRLRHNKLNSNIRQAKDRTKIIRLAIEEKKQRRVINIERLAELKLTNQERDKNLPKYDNKVKELEDYVSQRRDRFEEKRQSLKEKKWQLKKIVRLGVQHLFKYIFPITKIKPSIETQTLSVMSDVSQTTIIIEHWEYSEYNGETKYCIVGPTLPFSGNYSAYNIWVSQNQDVVPSSNSSVSVRNNPAFNMSAALTYTAQLVIILSYYLNIRLPCQMQYSDYCDCYMNEEQFTRRVARLNANILYLCFMQNVNLNTLHSVETIHNVLQLIEDEQCDLGRDGPAEYNYHHAKRLERPLLGNLKPGEESDCEDGDCFPVEWEAVPHVQCPEMAAGPAVTQAPQMMAQQASSMAGSLVNSAAASIASLWRGFTSR